MICLIKLKNINNVLCVKIFKNTMCTSKVWALLDVIISQTYALWPRKWSSWWTYHELLKRMIFFSYCTQSSVNIDRSRWLTGLLRSPMTLLKIGRGVGGSLLNAERGVLKSPGIIGIIVCPLNSQFLFHVCWSSVIICTPIFDCCILLINWPPCHYEISLFIFQEYSLSSNLLY